MESWRWVLSEAFVSLELVWFQECLASGVFGFGSVWFRECLVSWTEVNISGPVLS